MAKTMTVPAEVPVSAVKPELLRVLDALPPSRQAEVLNFARFLYRQAIIAEPDRMARDLSIEVRVVSAETLFHLTGLVALGGDALADTEALYDNSLH